MNYTKPKLVGTINGAGVNGGAISSIAYYKNEIFVASNASDTIKVYDTNTDTEKNTPFYYKRNFPIPGMKLPGDIVIWEQKEYLFLLDWTTSQLKKTMYITNLNGQKTPEIPTWSTENDFGRLSITKDSTILEAFHNQSCMTEYQPSGGTPNKIFLQKDVVNPQHALKLDGNSFLVCHGDPEDDQHRVCQVDNKGKILKEFGSTKGSGDANLNVPIYLQTDSNGSVLVLDQYNGRICLLDSSLAYLQDLVTRDDGLRFPMKMIYDEENDVLYVADNDIIENNQTDGRVLLYKIKEDA